MDNSSLCGTSLSEGKNSEAICNSSTSLRDQSSIDKLGTGLSGKLKINDGNRTNNRNDVQKIPVEGYYIEEEEEEEDFSEEELLAQMGYAKFEPKRDIIKEPERQYCDEEELSEESILAQMGYLKNEPKHERITTPKADLNLVSAFKGSRNKEGKPAKECRVSWAPDVHDPSPTSAEHFAPSKTERHKSEQKVKGAAGKNRQKGGGKWAGASEDGGGGGKGSRGGGSKGSVGGGSKAAGKDKDKKQVDKKQANKYGGSARKYSDYVGLSVC
ncbi:hypothetical protein Pfo_012804 [Paulownia fortunei]|nr:hypothetical protein Pfo_012804 [Paulownia fortunei]